MLLGELLRWAHDASDLSGEQLGHIVDDFVNANELKALMLEASADPVSTPSFISQSTTAGLYKLVLDVQVRPETNFITLSNSVYPGLKTNYRYVLRLLAATCERHPDMRELIVEVLLALFDRINKAETELLVTTKVNRKFTHLLEMLLFFLDSSRQEQATQKQLISKIMAYLDHEFGKDDKNLACKESFRAFYLPKTKKLRPSTQTEFDGMHAIFWAVKHGQFALVEQLLEFIDDSSSFLINHITEESFFDYLIQYAMSLKDISSDEVRQKCVADVHVFLDYLDLHQDKLAMVLSHTSASQCQSYLRDLEVSYVLGSDCDGLVSILRLLLVTGIAIGADAQESEPESMILPPFPLLPVQATMPFLVSSSHASIPPQVSWVTGTWYYNPAASAYGVSPMHQPFVAAPVVALAADAAPVVNAASVVNNWAALWPQQTGEERTTPHCTPGL